MIENINTMDMQLSGNIIYAGFWIRVWASIIDFMVLIPLIVLYFIILKTNNLYLTVISFSIFMLYKPVMESIFGATIGKIACKILIVDHEIMKIGIKRAFLRNSFYLLNALFSLFMIILSQQATIDGTFYDNFSDNLYLLRSETVFKIPDAVLNLLVIIDSIIIVINLKKKAFHDYIAKTICIYKIKNKES